MSQAEGKTTAGGNPVVFTTIMSFDVVEHHIGKRLLSSLCLMAIAVVPVLFSGCASSSMEDDYVSSVLAQAMRESGGPGVTSQPSTAPAVSVVVPVQTAPAVPVSTPVVVASAPAVAVPVAPPSVAAVSVPVVAAPVAPVAVPETPDSVELPAPAPVVTPATPVVSSQGPEAPATQSPVAGGPAVRTPTAGPSVGGKPPPAIPTIQPDSVLWVSVEEDPSLNGRYIVSEASAIDFGYVGLVFVPGMRVEQAESELKRVLEGRYLKVATVSVKLAKASYDRVGVQGSVDMPGDIKIGPGAGITLSEALRRAGGLKGNSENSRVKIVRGGMKTPFGPAADGEVFSLVTQDGTLKVPDVFLRNDDLVYVFSASSTGQTLADGVKEKIAPGGGGKRVILLGEVPHRGVIEFSENEPCTLMYLLFKIGGLPRFAKADKITVVRREKDGTEKSFMIDGEKLLNNGKPEDDMVLETGDRIVVPARKISFL